MENEEIPLQAGILLVCTAKDGAKLKTTLLHMRQGYDINCLSVLVKS